MTYNLKITNKQAGLIQNHIYDLCNYMFRDKISDYTDSDFDKYDEYDVYRIKIYFKEYRLNKSYTIFKNLTEKEVKFIKGELSHHCRERGMDMEIEDRKEMAMANRVIYNINKILDKEYQRDLILERILK